jgi:hypothetical protein
MHPRFVGWGRGRWCHRRSEDTEDAFWLRPVPGKVRWFTRPGLRGGRIRLVRAQFSAGADASTLHRRRNRRAHRLDHRGVPLGQDGLAFASGYAAGFTVLAPPSPPHCSSLPRKPASPWRRLARFRPCPALVRQPVPLTHCVVTEAASTSHGVLLVISAWPPCTPQPEAAATWLRSGFPCLRARVGPGSGPDSRVRSRP